MVGGNGCSCLLGNLDVFIPGNTGVKKSEIPGDGSPGLNSLVMINSAMYLITAGWCAAIADVSQSVRLIYLWLYLSHPVRCCKHSPAISINLQRSYRVDNTCGVA